jgi:hypothetical protein
MFPSTRTSTIAQRALDAARLARSFLLLEDDYDVDWEVDQDQRDEPEHPHRAQLRNLARLRRARRRPGQPASREQVCVCPVGNRTADAHLASSFPWRVWPQSASCSLCALPSPADVAREQQN